MNEQIRVTDGRVSASECGDSLRLEVDTPAKSVFVTMSQEDAVALSLAINKLLGNLARAEMRGAL